MLDTTITAAIQKKYTLISTANHEVNLKINVTEYNLEDQQSLKEICKPLLKQLLDWQSEDNQLLGLPKIPNHITVVFQDPKTSPQIIITNSSSAEMEILIAFYKLIFQSDKKYNKSTTTTPTEYSYNLCKPTEGNTITLQQQINSITNAIKDWILLIKVIKEQSNTASTSTSTENDDVTQTLELLKHLQYELGIHINMKIDEHQKNLHVKTQWAAFNLLDSILNEPKVFTVQLISKGNYLPTPYTVCSSKIKRSSHDTPYAQTHAILSECLTRSMCEEQDIMSKECKDCTEKLNQYINKNRNENDAVTLAELGIKSAVQDNLNINIKTSNTLNPSEQQALIKALGSNSNDTIMSYQAKDHTINLDYSKFADESVKQQSRSKARHSRRNSNQISQCFSNLMMRYRTELILTQLKENDCNNSDNISHAKSLAGCCPIECIVDPIIYKAIFQNNVYTTYDSHKEAAKSRILKANDIVSKIQKAIQDNHVFKTTEINSPLKRLVLLSVSSHSYEVAVGLETQDNNHQQANINCITKSLLLRHNINFDDTKFRFRISKENISNTIEEKIKTINDAIKQSIEIEKDTQDSLSKLLYTYIKCNSRIPKHEKYKITYTLTSYNSNDKTREMKISINKQDHNNDYRAAQTITNSITQFANIEVDPGNTHAILNETATHKIISLHRELIAADANLESLKKEIDSEGFLSSEAQGLVLELDTTLKNDITKQLKESLSLQVHTLPVNNQEPEQGYTTIVIIYSMPKNFLLHGQEVKSLKNIIKLYGDIGTVIRPKKYNAPTLIAFTSDVKQYISIIAKTLLRIHLYNAKIKEVKAALEKATEATFNFSFHSLDHQEHKQTITFKYDNDDGLIHSNNIKLIKVEEEAITVDATITTHEITDTIASTPKQTLEKIKVALETQIPSNYTVKITHIPGEKDINFTIQPNRKGRALRIKKNLTPNDLIKLYTTSNGIILQSQKAKGSTLLQHLNTNNDSIQFVEHNINRRHATLVTLLLLTPILTLTLCLITHFYPQNTVKVVVTAVCEIILCCVIGELFYTIKESADMNAMNNKCNTTELSEITLAPHKIIETSRQV